MMAPIKISAAGVFAVLAGASLINAHGIMSDPKATFTIQGDNTQFGLSIDSSSIKPPSGMSFTTDPLSNTKAFTAWLKTSPYKDLKALVAAKGVPIAGATKECGITSATGTKLPLPAKVEWSHGAGEGFTPSHEGPCEVWCDNVRVFQDDNCARNYPQIPAKLPYKKEQCAGKSVLKIIWIALHSPSWQVYLNCAPIAGGSGGGSGGSAPSKKAPAKKPATKAPAKASKPAKTQKSKARSMDYGFDELEN